MYDLPIKSLLDFDNFNRTKLTREYLKMQNKILGLDYVIPSIKFEKEWSIIEKNNSDKFLFLKAPPVYGYFMNKGIILKNNSKQISSKVYKSLCYKVDSTQKIKNDSC